MKISSYIKPVIASLAVMVGLSFSFVGVSQAAPIDVLCDQGNTKGNVGTGTDFCDNSNDTAFDLIKTIINVMLSIAGIIAVIMIIIGGIRYVTSSGEQANVKGAKDTILYAVVGLVITIMAFAVVNFVLGKLS